MARKIEPIDLEQAKILEKKKESLERAKKRLAKLEHEVHEVAGLVDRDVKQTLQPGWYEKKSVYGGTQYWLIQRVKQQVVTCKRDKPYEVTYLKLEAGKTAVKVIYLDENGKEQISANKLQGCMIERIVDEINYDTISRLSPIPPLQLLIKFGLSEEFVQTHVPRGKQDRTVWCNVNGDWRKIVGCVSEDLYDIFEE